MTAPVECSVCRQPIGEATVRYLTLAGEILRDPTATVDVFHLDDGSWRYDCRCCKSRRKILSGVEVHQQAIEHAENCRALPAPIPSRTIPEV